MKRDRILNVKPLWGAILVGCFIGTAHADDTVHDRVKNSVVYLKVTGKSVSAAGEQDVTPGIGTGFVISSSGLVLTTYHLIGGMGKNIIPESVSISGSLGTKKPDAQLSPVSFVDASIPLDLLLLRLRTDKEMTPVVLGDAEAYRNVSDKEIFTVGFPKDASTKPLFDKGIISATDGLGGNTWSMNMAPDNGASGSPVYVKEGGVIGIYKGSNDAGSGYFIPLELATSMIAHKKLNEIAQKLEDYNELRRRVTWSGKSFRQGRDKFNINISYRKWVRGEPQVSSATFTIRPVFQEHPKTDKPQPSLIFRPSLSPIKGRKPVLDKSRIEGHFEFKDLWNQLTLARDGFGGTNNDLYIRQIIVTINAKLNDKTVLPIEEVTISIEKPNNNGS